MSWGGSAKGSRSSGSAMTRSMAAEQATVRLIGPCTAMSAIPAPVGVETRP